MIIKLLQYLRSCPNTSIMMVFLLLLLGNMHAQDYVSISGAGFAIPDSVHPYVMVTAFNNATYDSLASTVTLPDGSYVISLVNAPEPTLFPLMTLLSNPFLSEAKLQLFVPVHDMYTLNAFDMSGKNIVNTTLELNSGNTEISVKGLGVPGTKIIQLYNEKEKHVYKAIQLENNSSFGVDVRAIPENPTGGDTKYGLKGGTGNLESILKSGNATLADSLYITFTAINSPLNYTVADTTIPFESQSNINYILHQIPDTYGFKMHPYAISGEEIPALTPTPLKIFIKNNAGVQEFTQGSDNLINVFFENYNPADTIVKVWTNNPDNLFASPMIIQHTNQGWTDKNVAQNRPFMNWTPGAAFDTLTTTLPRLSNSAWAEELELYLVKHNQNYGPNNSLTLTFESQANMGIMTRGGTWWMTNWKGDYPEGSGNPIPFIDRGIRTTNRTTGLPIGQDKIDEMVNIVNNIDTVLVTPTGRDLYKSQITYYAGQTDPIFISWANRNPPGDHTSLSYRENVSTPGNSVIISPTGRIQRGESFYGEGTSINVIFGEETEKTFYWDDYPSTTSSNTYTCNANGNYSELGISDARYNAMIDGPTEVLWTLGQKSSNNNTSSTVGNAFISYSRGAENHSSEFLKKLCKN